MPRPKRNNKDLSMSVQSTNEAVDKYQEQDKVQLDKQVKEESRDNSSVVVKLMHPGGLIFDLGKGKQITLNGCNSSTVKFKGAMMVGEMGTTVIKSDEWDAIKAKYGHRALFKNGLIFAESSKDRADDRAKETQRCLRHGLEPVNLEDRKLGTKAGKPQ